MSLFILLYVGTFFFFLRNLKDKLAEQIQESILIAENAKEVLIEKKDNLFKEKIDLENEALEIFILYEITREITRTFQEDEVFNIFKKKLREHVKFTHCRLLTNPVDIEAATNIGGFARGGPSSGGNSEGSKDDFIFTFQEKERKLGCLIIQGLSQEDEEKANILGHQFSLALRRIKLYQEIEKIAITDSLTELYTRRYALERFKEEVRRSKMRKIKMSFLMIDVDFFKTFNDTYGHVTGDQILKELGVIIKENIREIDIAGRYGGEEFSVMLPDTDRAGAQFAAERIQQAVEQASIKVYDTTVKVTVSIGIATFPEDAQEVDELTDKADSALYIAKKMGRNKVCFFGIYDVKE